MFDLSFGKLALLFTLCLIVLGPEKLPKLAAQLGRWTGQARAMARHFREQLEQEIATEELMKQKHEFEKVVADSIKGATDPVHDATQTVENVIHPPAASQIVASQVDVSHAELSHSEVSQGELWEDSHLSSGQSSDHIDLGQPMYPVSGAPASDSAATESASAAVLAHGSAESPTKSTDA